MFEFRYRTRGKPLTSSKFSMSGIVLTKDATYLEDLIKEAILRPPPDPAEDTPGKQTVVLTDDDDNDNVADKFKEEAKVVKQEGEHTAGVKREAGEASEAPPSRRFKQTRRPDGKFLVDLTDD